MKNLLFYFATVLIWGSTWIGIKMQLGVVDPVLSVAYRFTLASIILLLWCWFRRLKMNFNIGDHWRMALQGVLLFGGNYLLFYMAELHITSGLAAVLFSTILLMNMVNGSLFLGQPIDSRVVSGGALGLIGIVLVFKQEITVFSLDNGGFLGVLLCLVATLLASFGNIVSARNQQRKLPIVQSNAYGMGYGAISMLLIAVVTGKEFHLDTSFNYVIALFYLAVFGSIIAFGCYLSLLGRIGAGRAAYATLLFPIVALVISTIWEDYHWTGSAITGIILILLGNLRMIQKEKLQLNLLRSLSIPGRSRVSKLGKYYG
jgi:drug/metabolite transporter (DMT)-like permease